MTCRCFLPGTKNWTANTNSGDWLGCMAKDGMTDQGRSQLYATSQQLGYLPIPDQQLPRTIPLRGAALPSPYSLLSFVIYFDHRDVCRCGVQMLEIYLPTGDSSHEPPPSLRNVHAWSSPQCQVENENYNGVKVNGHGEPSQVISQKGKSTQGQMQDKDI